MMKSIKKFNKKYKNTLYVEFIFGKELACVDFVTVDDEWIKSFHMTNKEFIHIPVKFWEKLE